MGQLSKRENSLHPGSIDNSPLYEQDDNENGLKRKSKIMKLKKGLVRNKDYKMVNEHVWYLFISLYGGGPIIVRSEKDLYSTKYCDVLYGCP